MLDKSVQNASNLVMRMLSKSDYGNNMLMLKSVKEGFDALFFVVNNKRQSPEYLNRRI